MKKQYHVYQVSKNGEYKAVDATGCNSIQEVEKNLPPNVAWYGLVARSENEAIQTVKKKYDSKGGLFKEPEAVKELESMADDLSARCKEFFL